MLELHTDRLYLRALVETDWPLFLTLHREPETMRHVFDELPESEIRRGFEHRLPAWTAKAEHWLCLVMTDKATQQDLGVTGLRILRPGHAEVGYLLLPEHQGLGFGTESLRAVIGHATAIGLGTLEATITDGNVASCRVMDKCGFTFERREPDAYLLGGTWRDDLIYRLDLHG
ncbi:GNAT family N-acetyltransferase [Pseudomonas entomophila]|uniref:GNAT family N-acetyltransferase n=2 Tax=Pseudomonas entomophila TaxID=312306 RepID=A0ABY9QKR4_9PSED|nr:GNAT family N-acetyltransferase [Pseudomonas entomophila]WMW03736.1 GNAT family N-acetyltransferase [Pseudomonas entomophila]CAK15510.1 putative acetyltransferase, GNAT family [Pseudomonas entomophila L48]